MDELFRDQARANTQIYMKTQNRKITMRERERERKRERFPLKFREKLKR